MPDATQWDQIEKGADGCEVVCALLETWAAQGELIHQDDTAVRMLTLRQEKAQRQAHAVAQGFARCTERPGMFTTALGITGGEQLIWLDDSGRAHAGENRAALLEQRAAEPAPPRVMSEALARHEVPSREGLTATAAGVRRCHGLAPGRRQGSDIVAVLPLEGRVVREVLQQRFDHDEEARGQQRSPQARLTYHQTSSQPLLEALKAGLDTPLQERLGEPNRSLGKAIA